MFDYFEQEHWNIFRILVGWALCELIWHIQSQLAMGNLMDPLVIFWGAADFAIGAVL